MPNLPPFTVHDLIKKDVPDPGPGTVELTKEELKEMYPMSVKDGGPSVKEIKEVLKDEFGMTPIFGSSNIIEIGWKDNICRVKFLGEKLYEYYPVENDLYKRFLDSKSKGNFFAQHIRNNKNIRFKRII